MESCSRIKDGNGMLAQGEDEVRRVWKEYFEDLYNIDTQEKVALMGFKAVTTSEENLLEELRLGESQEDQEGKVCRWGDHWRCDKRWR